MSIEIKTVGSDKKLLRQYLNFQHDLYEGDTMYVPELYMSQKELFDKAKNPFFEHAQVESFLAYRGDKIVGRISAIANGNYNHYHGSNVGFFGFFDFINDLEIARSLIEKAADWCRHHGFEAMLGPTNFSTNDTAGTLVEGFHEPPKIMMTYNKPYYGTIMDQLGCTKEMDLLAYILYTDKASDKSIRLASTLEERLNRQGISFRNIRLKDFKNEVASIRDIYNDAWSKNWGFVPWTDREMDHLAKELKMLVNDQWVYVAEDHGIPIGFALTIHDINEITKNFKKGRLFPVNIIKLLLRKNKTRFVRILALGVKESYRRRGIEAIFFAKNILQARKENIVAGEVSWVLESNAEMVASAERLNSEMYKRYRIYRYNLQ